MGARWCADMGMLYSLASCRVVSLAGWKKVKAPVPLWCGWTVVWCMLLGSRTASPLVGGGVPFPPSWPCPLWGGCLGWCGVVV